jgi:hypothetical protein
VAPRAIALACALGLAVAQAPIPARAAEGVTPTLAAESRKPVQEQARGLRVSGQHSAAGDLLARKAVELKDPVLFLDAAEAYNDAGKADRSLDLVHKAIEHASTAGDILHFLGDDRASATYKPVSDDHRQALLSRVDDVLAASHVLLAEIESPTEPTTTEPADEDRRAKPGRVAIIAGAAAAGVGVLGLGLGAAGLGIGANAQSSVDEPTVYGEEYDEWDAKGRRGNVLAFVGLPLAALGLGAGIALIAIGLKKRKAGASADAAARLQVAPSPGGLVFSGRF